MEREYTFWRTGVGFVAGVATLLVAVAVSVVIGSVVALVTLNEGVGALVGLIVGITLVVIGGRISMDIDKRALIRMRRNKPRS